MEVYRILRSEIALPRSTKSLFRRKAVDAVANDRDNGFTFTATWRRNMSEILAHTPRWVFILFVGLVFLGLQQSKTRTVTFKRLMLLPLAMAALSLYSIWSTFNGSTLGLACGVVAMLGTAALSQRFDFAKGVRYLAQTHSFILPGSWLPLALMMAIFVTKYGVGIALAQHGQWRDVAPLIAAVGAVYGFWSGIFVGRMAQILARHGRPVMLKAAA